MTTTIKTKCLVCDGSGVAEYERPVVDHLDGGEIDVWYDRCSDCSGEGEVHILSVSSCQELLLAIRTAEKILEDADIVDWHLDEMYAHIRQANSWLDKYIKHYNYD